MTADDPSDLPGGDDAAPRDTTLSGGPADKAQEPSRGATRSAELLDRMVRSAHQSIDRLAETAAPRLDRLEHGVSGAASALHARGEHWRELSDEWTDGLRTTVREHPLAAVGIALALGMLLARLSSRR